MNHNQMFSQDKDGKRVLNKFNRKINCDNDSFKPKPEKNYQEFIDTRVIVFVITCIAAMLM